MCIQNSLCGFATLRIQVPKLYLRHGHEEACQCKRPFNQEDCRTSSRIEIRGRKNHDEEKNDEDAGREQEIEGQQGNQVKPFQTKAKAKTIPKGVAKAKAKGKTKAKSSSSKGGNKKPPAKKDTVKKLVKKKTRRKDGKKRTTNH